MKQLANVLVFLIFVALVTIALFGIIVDGQERVPLATEMQKAFAPLAVSEDGSTVTFRDTAKDALRICVEADEHTFSRRICFTLRDVRTGRWGLK
jgi:hypothetical protein